MNLFRDNLAFEYKRDNKKLQIYCEIEDQGRWDELGFNIFDEDNNCCWFTIPVFSTSEIVKDLKRLIRRISMEKIITRFDNFDFEHTHENIRLSVYHGWEVEGRWKELEVFISDKDKNCSYFSMPVYYDSQIVVDLKKIVSKMENL